MTGLRPVHKGVGKYPGSQNLPAQKPFHALSFPDCQSNAEAQGNQQGHHKKVAGSLERHLLNTRVGNELLPLLRRCTPDVIC